jgi:hypothetical protein
MEQLDGIRLQGFQQVKNEIRSDSAVSCRGARKIRRKRG